jgi:hypothetical protein
LNDRPQSKRLPYRCVTFFPAIFAEMDGLKGLVEKGDLTIEQARARFLELLEKQLVGERLLAVTRPWGATPGNA